MSWLILSAFLQFGIAQGSALMYQPPDLVYAQFPPIYEQLNVRAEAGLLFFEADLRADFQPMSWDNWFPEQMTYILGAGLKIGPLTVGAKRICYHPVAPYMEHYGYQLLPYSEGAINDFYVRLEFKSK